MRRMWNARGATRSLIGQCTGGECHWSQWELLPDYEKNTDLKTPTRTWFEVCTGFGRRVVVLFY